MADVEEAASAHGAARPSFPNLPNLIHYSLEAPNGELSHSHVIIPFLGRENGVPLGGRVSSKRVLGLGGVFIFFEIERPGAPCR